jgi:hypothetical protein
VGEGAGLGMQEIKHFGSVTVIVSGSGESAAVLSHRPELLHQRETDWNQAVKWVISRGFEAPADDPTSSSPEAGETYVVRQSARAEVGA